MGQALVVATRNDLAAVCYNIPIKLERILASQKDQLSPGSATQKWTWRWLKALAPLLLFILLTVVAARDVVVRLDSVIVGSDQDVFINPWADMWTLRALQDPARSLWFTDSLFYPHGTNLHFHSFSHLTSLVSLALRPLLGTLAAYNLTILVHVALAGFAMFHLARYLTGSAPAASATAGSTAGALLAGVVFAFNSHNLWQTSHPVLVSIWPLPWAALFLLQALERCDKRRAFAAAIFVFLAALCSTLMLILMAIWLAFILFYALVTHRLRRPALPALGLFLLASTALAVLPLLPLLSEFLLRDNTSFVIDTGSNLPTDVLAPLRPYWRGLLSRSLHFGVIPTALLLTSLFRMRKTWPWLLLLIIVYLFAIGPRPRVGGVEASITLPWSDAVRPLLRHTHRLNVLLSAGLAVLVAYGWTAIDSRLGVTRRRHWLLAATLGILIFAEYTYPSFAYRAPPVSAFYTDYLDAVPDDVALAILPTGRQEDKLYMYYQTLHGHPMTGGVVSRPRQDVFRFIRDNPLLRAAVVNWEPVSLPDDPVPALEQLADAGVGYLVLEKALFAQTELDLDAWVQRLPVAPSYEDDLVVVFPTDLH